VDTTGSVYSSFSSPTINASGVVAATAAFNAGGQVLLTGTGGAPTILTNTNTGVFSQFFGTPVIASDGTVLVRGILDSGVQGLYKFSGGSFTAYVDNAGPYSGFGSGPAMSDNGNVAFQGFLDAGGSGIYTGSNPVTNKVIAVGDALDGSTVQSVNLYSEGIDDSGQVAFLANLANGTSGIYRADPVPEPGSAAMLGIGTLGLLAARRRTKN
jgi:hypothetical protein